MAGEGVRVRNIATGTEVPITYSQSIRAIPILLLIYVWIRGLTAQPLSAYALSLYQALPADLIIALGMVGLSILLISREYPFWAAICVAQFFIAVAIIPTLQTQFIHLTTDSFMHVGRVAAILEQGHTPARNLYPAMHWLSATLVELTGLPPRSVAIAVVATNSAALGLFAVLCIGRLSLSRSVVSIAVFSAMLGVFSPDLYNFASWGQFGRLFIVLTVFLLLASRGQKRVEWVILFSVVLISSGFAHPLIATSLFGFLGIIIVYQFLYSEIRYPSLRGVHVLFAPGIVIAQWLLQAPTFANTLESIVASIFLPSGARSSRLARRAEQLGAADIAPIDIVIQFLGTYGATVIFLGGLLVLVTLRTLLARGRSADLQPLAIGTVAFWVFGTAMFVLPVPFGPGRFWAVAIILGTIVIGGDLVALSSRFPRGRQAILVLVFVGILIVYALAAPTVYGSVFARSPNEQMTAQEYSGAEFLFAHTAPESEIRSIGTPIRNIVSFQQSSNTFRTGAKPLPHFQEFRDGSFSGYIIIAPPAGMTYPAYYSDYPEAWKYTPEDYRWMENAGPNRIYHSGDTSLYSS